MLTLAARSGRAPTKITKCPLCSLQQSRPSSTTQSSSVAPPQTAATKKPPPLPRPLGIRRTARSSPLSPEEKRIDMIQRNAQQRAVLTKELKKSYFDDFSDAQRTGGKAWTAPETVIRADRSLYFPTLQGTALSDKEMRSTTELLPGKVTLVTTLSNQVSVEHAKAYIDSAQKIAKGNAAFQIVQLNLQDNPLKSFLLSMFLSRLRSDVPENLQSTYLLVSQNMELLRDPLGMTNKQVAYIYLVDESSRIRWAAVGEPTQSELHNLESCTQVLLTRLASGKSEE